MELLEGGGAWLEEVSLVGAALIDYIFGPGPSLSHFHCPPTPIMPAMYAYAWLSCACLLYHMDVCPLLNQVPKQSTSCSNCWFQVFYHKGKNSREYKYQPPFSVSSMVLSGVYKTVLGLCGF